MAWHTVSWPGMCTGRWRHGVPQAPLCHSRTTRLSSVKHGKLWTTGILVRWSSRLELTARTPATNYFNRPFQELSENVFIRTDVAFSALETFCLMGYISLLTYLLTSVKYPPKYPSRAHLSLWASMVPFTIHRLLRFCVALLQLGYITPFTAT